MSYAAAPVGYLGTWDSQVAGAPAQTYRLVIGAVRNLPSGAAELVPERLRLFVQNAGFDMVRAYWGEGGRVILEYHAVSGTPAYRSGVERRRVVEGALDAAARSIGPAVRFEVGATTPAGWSINWGKAWPWLAGAAGLALFGTLAFAAGGSVEGVRLRRNKRRRRKRR